jgi:hypothetical protein
VTQTVLLALHIAVLGYWFGADLVINSEYRFVVRRGDLPVAARDALMDHVMKVDQHVRYALVLQAMLGAMLLAEVGLAPAALGWIAPLVGAAWLTLVEVTHRTRKSPRGAVLARIDRALRYAVAALLVVLAIAMTDWPGWLRIKLTLFVGVIGCGVLIRFALIRHFTVWQALVANGSTADREAQLRAIYLRASGVLLVLWMLVMTIAALALFKPA